MMSLRGFHLFFIAASIALSVMVALWGVGMYGSDQGSWGHLAFSVGALLTGAGMALYLVGFTRKARRIGMR
jgi:hypothetical protein